MGVEEVLDFVVLDLEVVLDFVELVDLMVVDVLEVVLDLDVEVEVLDDVEDFDDETMLVLLVDGATLLLLLLLASEESMYISRRLPAPQYSYWLPGQVKEQSDKVVLTDPALGDVPQ